MRFSKSKIKKARHKMKLLLFGPQGAGKGTIGNLLSKKYKISLIGAGAILRDAIKNKTPLGKIAEKYIHKGKLVPAKVIAKVVNEKIKKQKKGYMLDGFQAYILFYA